MVFAEQAGKLIKVSSVLAWVSAEDLWFDRSLEWLY